MKRMVVLLTMAVVASTGSAAGQDLRTEVLAAEQTRKASPGRTPRATRRVHEGRSSVREAVCQRARLPNESWKRPVDVYFRRNATGWTLVGVSGRFSV